MRTERVKVRPEVELHVHQWDGAGRPFVLVHGLASNLRLWDGVARRLAEAGHPVVAVDQRGHGHSDKPDGPYDMATVADDLLALVDAVGFDRPVLAGQSWGGNVVLEAAHRGPDTVGAIALVDGGWIHLADAFATFDACAEALRPPALAGMARSRLEAAIRSMHPSWPEEGIEGTLANFEVLDDGTIRPWLTLDRHLAILRGLYEHRPRSLYPSAHLPVLLAPAVGREPSRGWDQRAAVDEALAALPDGRVRWFEGADHDLHAQHPAELAQALLELTDER